jgi:succinyl-diaminopimelate desuccinylase
VLCNTYYKRRIAGIKGKKMKETIVDLLEKLIAFESVSTNKIECQLMLTFVQKYLGSNLKVVTFGNDGVSNLLIYSKEHKPNQPFRILFNAHLDVVPAPVEMFKMTIDGDRAMGRGVYDMKAAGAVMIELFLRLAKEHRLPADVGLMLVTDEEIGGLNGTKSAFESGLAETEFFFGGEPTDFKILSAHKGVVQLKVIYSGKPAHGSRPWAGENANIKLATAIANFYRHNPSPVKEVWETTYSLNLMAGGTAGNVISDKAEATFDIRRIETEPADKTVAKLATYFPGAEISIQFNEPGLFTDQNTPYVKRVAEIVKKRTGQNPVFMREHFATDARFYSSKGVPAVHVGPIGGGIHQYNEWVSLSSLAVYSVMLEDVVHL